MKCLALALAASLVLASSVATFAQTASPRPPYATTKVDGTDNVYIFRNRNHQSM